MSSFAFLWPTAACVITGLALYVTRGVLDQTVTQHGVIRFAMLPPWQALLGFTCMAGLVLVGVDHLNAPRGTTSLTRPRLSALVLPLFSLIVLLLPYTPVLPDQWPVLQALAGPLGAIVWLSVAALQVWVLWQSRLITAARDRALEPDGRHHRDFRVDRGRRRARRAAAHQHHALSIGGRAALPGDRAKPVA